MHVNGQLKGVNMRSNCEWGQGHRFMFLLVGVHHACLTRCYFDTSTHSSHSKAHTLDQLTAVAAMTIHVCSFLHVCAHTHTHMHTTLFHKHTVYTLVMHSSSYCQCNLMQKAPMKKKEIGKQNP